ncbi:MAG: DUF2309 domain-containing protein [Azonexus sp.]|nr:DUF2309 domain-containing protein [Azonexus sp.]
MTQAPVADASLAARLATWVEHLAHVLPAQAPIRDFVHHNTLHGFQHLPFAEALPAASRLTGAQTYWPESRFHEAFAAGRIDEKDLLAGLEELGLPAGDTEILPGLPRRSLWMASLLAGPGSATTTQWRRNESLLADAALFAHCEALTADNAAAAPDWLAQARSDWLACCERVGHQTSLRALLLQLSGEDVLETVRTILQRHLAAHLDMGMAAWSNPARGAGFLAAWKACAGLDLAWELDELPGIRDEIRHLPDDPIAILAEALPALCPDEARWPAWIEALALELPGWGGMFLWHAQHPGQIAAPVAMADYLAIRVFLERHLCADLIRRLTGQAGTLADLRTYYLAHPAEFVVRHALAQGDLPEDLQAEAAALVANAIEGHAGDGWAALAPRIAAAPTGRPGSSAAQLYCLLRALEHLAVKLPDLSPETAAQVLAEANALNAGLRGQAWLAAYEAHYRDALFGALAASAQHPSPVPAPTAQIVCCMDDREEGTRRHLEEVAPDIETFGAAGFFGVPMYWQGLDDGERTALCPVVVTPANAVRELPAVGKEAAYVRHQARRETRLRWRERLYQGTRRSPWLAPWLVALAAVPALGTLAANLWSPAWFGRTTQRWRDDFDGVVSGRLALNPEDSSTPPSDGVVQAGFSDEAQVDRVEAFLRMIGLTEGFAPLVLMLGHGSSSRNNPHRSAYACGACSGRHGGPNARVFAAMANRPEVRAGLAARGITVPDSCWFLAAEHNTCDDSVDWYDLDQVPAAWQAASERLLGQVAEACRRHAVERCRRLASAPLRPSPWLARRHVAGRAQDISQARPELGHATNAAALIGRRRMSRGLFLDRRVFLISYDPASDPAGDIVEGILLAAGPVGAGISLEYYFSTVDNERFGCGSKVTHNLSGLFGVMAGADSDLRTGLPLQMVEIHEPMRLLVVVEQTEAVLTAILSRQPPLQELIGGSWIILGARHPSTGALSQYCPRRGWQAWTGAAVLPQVADSATWFAGESGPLPPAWVRGKA